MFRYELKLGMPGLGWRKAGEKNLKGGPKDNFLKFSLNVKGVPTYVSK